MQRQTPVKRWILPQHPQRAVPVESPSIYDGAVSSVPVSSSIGSNQNSGSPLFDFIVAEAMTQPDWSILTNDALAHDFSAHLPGYSSLPSPALQLSLGRFSQYAGLPTLVPLTDADRNALDYYQRETAFGFGSKAPVWSTHAILLESGTQDAAIIHLLLAAAFAEMAWQGEDCSAMHVAAEKHHQIGCQALLEKINAEDNQHHLVIMACFWFLFLQQRRRPLQRHIAYEELSRLMVAHVRKHQLDLILTSADREVSRRGSLLARLAVWLFWVDVQSCFHGEGGSLARQLFSAPSTSASTTRSLDLFECSRATLELHWGSRYPISEIRDDIENSSTLELIHRTWVIVQELNEEGVPCVPERRHEIGAKMEALRRKFGSVFRLADDLTSPRDRLLCNADWAACNFHALTIYHHRWSSPEGGVGVADTVADLLSIIRKTLAGGGKGQLDRVQWPLFWAGVETDDVYYQDWISARMTNRRLQAALQAVYQEQVLSGSRVNIGRIRQLCRQSCADVLLSDRIPM